MSRIPHLAGRVPYSTCNHAPYDLPEYRGGGSGGSAPSYTYATWNPADKGVGIVLSDGDLTATAGGGWTAVRATQGKTTGDWYFETEIVSNDVGILFGVATAASPLTYHGEGGANGWGIGLSGGTGYSMAPGSASPNGMSASVGDSFACALRRSTNELLCYKISGGVGSTIATFDISSMAGVALYPMLSLFTASGTANFGPAPFAKNPPVPLGCNEGVYE